MNREDTFKLAHKLWPEEFRYDTGDDFVTFTFDELHQFARAAIEQALTPGEPVAYAYITGDPWPVLYTVVGAKRHRNPEILTPLFTYPPDDTDLLRQALDALLLSLPVQCGQSDELYDQERAQHRAAIAALGERLK